MEQTKITLDTSAYEPKLDPQAAYLVDFSKLTSVNDLVLILSAMGFTFAGSHPFIDQVRPFLALDNPIYPGGPKPEKKEMSLPKLQKIKKDGE